MVLDYLNVLTQSIAITDSMFNCGKFFTKNATAIAILSIRDREKKNISRPHETLLGIQCCHQKCQSRKKKINFVPKYFFYKIVISQKAQIFRKDNICFRILKVLLAILTTY